MNGKVKDDWKKEDGRSLGIFIRFSVLDTNAIGNRLRA